MDRQIVLLRGVNLGARNRISMPELRAALAEAAFDHVQTYVQSGNVVLSAKSKPEQTAREVERLLDERFGLAIDVVVRTRAELAHVIANNPLADVAKDPKRYQVTFLSKGLDPSIVQKLEAAAAADERVVISGREIYAWHPRTIARSKLWSLLASGGLGVAATARNWTTVTKLLELADER